MAETNKAKVLHEALELLRARQAQELTTIKTQFELTHQYFVPSQFFKNILQEVVTKPNIKNDLMDLIIGLIMGYLSKKMVIGSTRNPIKKVFGWVLEFVIANFTAKHTQAIKSIGGYVIKRFFKK